MQKPNPVIKNYIYSSDIFVLDDTKSINVRKKEYIAQKHYFWKLLISCTLRAK